jgi:hypothetical protein
MVKQTRYSFLSSLVIFILIGCGEIFLPEGYYDYQVYRLLSNDSTKLWVVERIDNTSSLFENCEDSTFYSFESLDDSLSILNLGRNCGGIGFDTLSDRIGIAGVVGIYFSDTLFLPGDDFWVIENLTSQMLTYRTINGTRYSLAPVNND